MENLHFFFFFVRDDQCKIRKKQRATITCVKKKGRLSVCAHMRFKDKGKISDRKSPNGAGRRRRTLFLAITSLLYGIVFWQYLDGWRIGQ